MSVVCINQGALTAGASLNAVVTLTAVPLMVSTSRVSTKPVGKTTEIVGLLPVLTDNSVVLSIVSCNVVAAETRPFLRVPLRNGSAISTTVPGRRTIPESMPIENVQVSYKSCSLKKTALQ